MLEKNKKYLQIAFNRTLRETAAMINALPLSDRIIIEAGYPLIKTYGVNAIGAIKNLWQEIVFGSGPETTASLGVKLPQRAFSPYIVADLKCMDRAFTEVEAASSAGASAVTCLGLAPIETIDAFIGKCEEAGIDSVLDMMNIEYPFEILSELARPPSIVMLHRGVDEAEENREKEVPYHEIERIKNVYDDVLIAVAGGEKINEVITGAFNDADIVIVWRLFNENPDRVAALAGEFLREIK